jgi:hypothetical protein
MFVYHSKQDDELVVEDIFVDIDFHEEENVFD